MWKLANLIPIPKPNKDTNMGTSYRPISLLSVVAKTLEKCLLPYATANITQTPTQHAYKAQHSTVTALHTINNTVAKGFNWTQHNNLIINPVQNHLHSVDPRSSWVQQQFGPKHKQQRTTHGITPQGFGSNFRSKAHIQNIATHAQKPL